MTEEGRRRSRSTVSGESTNKVDKGSYVVEFLLSLQQLSSSACASRSSEEISADMELLYLFCISLSVSLVVSGTVNKEQRDLEEYQLAARKHHRKIRSSQTEEVIQLPPTKDANPLPTEGLSGSTLAPPTPAKLNNSFLLDLPYPSHFIHSLQLLNVSLPFLDQSTLVLPEDPPTPQFDIKQVLNNQQFVRLENDDIIYGRPQTEGTTSISLATGAKKVIRSRNRMPPAQYRRPTRSVDLLVEPDSSTNTFEIEATTLQTPTTIRNWIASQKNQGVSPHRRLEFYSKNRATTTLGPTKPIKKFQPKVLLDRRANATKTYHRYRQTSTTPTTTATDELAVESTTESPLVEEQTSSNSEQPVEASIQMIPLASDRSFDPQRVQMSGFRPSLVGSAIIHISPASGKYLSQFESTEEDRSNFSLQRPSLLSEDNVEEISSSSESVFLSITPASVELNQTYPSFELASGSTSNGSANLPPPLSIEDLIKKFTGSDPITDSPKISTTTSRPDDEELQSLEDLEASLKQLLAATVSSSSASNTEDKSREETVTTTLAPVLASPPQPFIIIASTEGPEPTTYKPESTHQNQQSVQRGPLDVTSGSGGVGSNNNFVDGAFAPGFGQGGFQPVSYNFQPVNIQQQHQPSSFGGFGGGDPNAFGVQQANPYFYTGLSNPSGQSSGGFDGLLHYSPTGPPAGEFNAITQGLYLLASFGGGGIPQQQQPHQFQQPQQQFGGDFNPSPQQFQFQQQPTVPHFPVQQFSQGFPSFGFIQQPQPQFQAIQQQPQHHPTNFQHQPSFGTVQQGPQQVFFQQQSPVPNNQHHHPNQGINPAQFGSLLSGQQFSVPTSSGSVGTSGISDVASGGPDKTERSGSASQLVEYQLQPVTSNPSLVHASTASPVELIAIGTPRSVHGHHKDDSSKRISKKSLYVRGLHSGYYQ